MVVYSVFPILKITTISYTIRPHGGFSVGKYFNFFQRHEKHISLHVTCASSSLFNEVCQDRVFRVRSHDFIAWTFRMQIKEG